MRRRSFQMDHTQLRFHPCCAGVDALTYEDGSYEWLFPMVVGRRYISAKESEPTDKQFNHSPAHARYGIRSGHDISLELDLDAGVPIFGVRSETHETEVQQLSERRSIVRLKDRTTIPNKDFVLTYRVAGDSINDAVLTHRSERGGFFTLILQPPQCRRTPVSGGRVQPVQSSNFEDPRGIDLATGGSLEFGQSIASSGARTMRFSLKFLF